MVDFSLIELVPAKESDREFSYKVKKTAEGGYITQLWGWDEELQREYHGRDWGTEKPDIIRYKGVSVGTILVIEKEDYIKVGQFFILPEYQNHGIGSYLLKNILDGADRTHRMCKLTFLKNNPVASLYERNGFIYADSDEHFCYMERQPQYPVKITEKYSR